MPADDAIIVVCPSCSQKYRVPEKRIGQKAMCKKCGGRFRIAIEAPIDEDTLFGWVMEGDPSNDSVMGSTSIFGTPYAPNGPLAVAPVPTTPRITLDDVTPHRARFSFPESALSDAGLRVSFPVRCANCRGKENLNVQLLIWAEAAPAAQREALRNTEHRTVRPLSTLRREHPDWQVHLPVIAGLPEPFNLPFPYYLCSRCRDSDAVACRVSTTDDGHRCHVEMTHLPLAVEFFRNNGGRATQAYQRLLVASQQQQHSQWPMLPTEVRARISQWFSLREGETFLGFYADGARSSHNSGAAGLVLTDRRIVCKKDVHRIEFYLNRGGSIEVEAGKTRATIVVRQGKESEATIDSTPLNATSMAKTLKSLHKPWKIHARINR